MIENSEALIFLAKFGGGALLSAIAYAMISYIRYKGIRGLGLGRSTFSMEENNERLKQNSKEVAARIANENEQNISKYSGLPPNYRTKTTDEIALLNTLNFQWNNGSDAIEVTKEWPKKK